MVTPIGIAYRSRSIDSLGVTESKQARHRKRRRAEGMCREEGCNELSGSDRRCPDHAAKHAATEKLRYWRKRSQVAAA